MLTNLETSESLEYDAAHDSIGITETVDSATKVTLNFHSYHFCIAPFFLCLRKLRNSEDQLGFLWIFPSASYYIHNIQVCNQQCTSSRACSPRSISRDV